MNESSTIPKQGLGRVVIENVAPEIHEGHFTMNSALCKRVVVEAYIYAEGHDSLSAVLKFRPGKNKEWTEIPLELLANDRWRGEFVVTEPGNYFYTIEAWADQFKLWQKKFLKKVEAGQDISVELQTGAKLIEAAAQRATARDTENLLAWAREFVAGESVTGNSIASRALDRDLTEMTRHYLDRQFSTSYGKELSVNVGPENPG